MSTGLWVGLAHSAIQVSKIKVRANYKGVQRLKVGHIKGDGRITTILVDGYLPTYVEEVLGAKEVYKVFTRPLKYLEERDIEVCSVWEDSYELDTGYWSHSTEHQTKKLTMKIVFHRHRTCKDVRGTISYAGEVHEHWRRIYP